MKFLFGVQALIALAIASPFEFDRRAPPGCTADNCLRALTVTNSNLKTTRPVLAMSDCAVFLMTTTTTTITPAISTVYKTATTLTSTTTTSYTTATQTSIIVIPTVSVVMEGKRDLPVHPISIPNGPTVPAYASPCIDVARFKSACSCAGYAGLTVTVSNTLPTITSTISRAATSIIVQVQTSSVTVTTSTTTTSVSITTTLPDVCIDDTYPASDTHGKYFYYIYYTGAGYSEDTTAANPAGQIVGTTTFPYTGDDCAAVQSCTNYLATVIPEGTGSYDLHFVVDSAQGISQWYCVVFKNNGEDSSYFNTPNPSIVRAYGVSFYFFIPG